MGNCVEAYRAAIGLFYCRKRNRRSFPYILTDTYQEILLTYIRCSLLFLSLAILQSSNNNTNIVFLLFVLHFILIIGNVEQNPGPVGINESNTSNTPINNTDRHISICNINIRSVRNKLGFLENFTDEYDIVTVVESHLSSNIPDDDLMLDTFSTNIIRKDRNDSGGGILIYIKEDFSITRKRELENPIDETTGADPETH